MVKGKPCGRVGAGLGDNGGAGERGCRWWSGGWSGYLGNWVREQNYGMEAYARMAAASDYGEMDGNKPGVTAHCGRSSMMKDHCCSMIRQ